MCSASRSLSLRASRTEVYPAPACRRPRLGSPLSWCATLAYKHVIYTSAVGFFHASTSWHIHASGYHGFRPHEAMLPRAPCGGTHRSGHIASIRPRAHRTVSIGVHSAAASSPHNINMHPFSKPLSHCSHIAASVLRIQDHIQKPRELGLDAGANGVMAHNDQA
jgi:hypothetical protein